MAFNFDRVVAYGCSFTAGQELADSIVLNRSEDEIDEYKRKHGIHCYMDIYGTEEIRAKCNQESSKLSWPNYIAEKMNVPCINRAHFGTSVNEFIFNIERDLACGNITDTDLILVGMTTPVRFSWVSKNGTIITKFIGDSRWENFKDLNDALLDTWATDNNLMWEYIKHMRHLDLISRSLGGRLKMAMCVLSLDVIKTNLSEYSKYLPWLDQINFDNVLSPSVCMSNFTARNYISETHGWGHPKVAVQKRFSEHIWSALIANGTIDV